MPSTLNGFGTFSVKSTNKKIIKDARGIHSSSPLQSPSFKGFPAPILHLGQFGHSEPFKIPADAKS